MIKTLIVDDSPLVRSILKDFLESEGSFEIIGEAENGQESVNKTRELSPDLVTMDIEMPVMNGLDAILEIKKTNSCGIVVISNHDTAKMAYDAIVSGAHEFFAKDIFTSKISDMKREEIFRILKQISNLNNAAGEQNAENHGAEATKKINCITIASSTGGPMALCHICSALPENFPVPILLVQHNTSGFDKSFVQWLNGYSRVNVQLAEEGTIPLGGNVYVAPTDKHIVINNKGIAFDDGEPVNNQKPSADVLFKSASNIYRDSLVSIVLTGMGNDGAEGTRFVKQAGGTTIAQDKTSSMIFGMPQSAIETGCVELILPLNEIANKLVSLTCGG
jgi:two-component system, chemotaxis family, protein-glutamate methylesterase/glutaminase